MKIGAGRANEIIRIVRKRRKKDPRDLTLSHLARGCELPSIIIPANFPLASKHLSRVAINIINIFEYYKCIYLYALNMGLNLRLFH